MKRAETTFYQDDAVKITSARAVIWNTTYALSNITSVRSWTEKKKRAPLLLGILLVLLGTPALTWDTPTVGAGILIIGAICVAFYVFSKDKHYVRIGTAGGETNALEGTDADYISAVVASLNDAIIHRG